MHEMNSQLIFDIGLHEGQDTAYYLQRGFRVVAVDANPAMVDKAQEKFAAAISENRLILVNAGIGHHPGQLTFWVSSKTQWSSFDREGSTRLGFNAEPVMIPVITAQELF